MSNLRGVTLILAACLVAVAADGASIKQADEEPSARGVRRRLQAQQWATGNFQQQKQGFQQQQFVVPQQQFQQQQAFSQQQPNQQIWTPQQQQQQLQFQQQPQQQFPPPQTGYAAGSNSNQQVLQYGQMPQQVQQQYPPQQQQGQQQQSGGLRNVPETSAQERMSGGAQQSQVASQENDVSNVIEDSSPALPGGCSIEEPVELEVVPTWTASFPGSGTKLFWKTIQSLTGLFTGDDNDTTGRFGKGVVVTVKTHFPSAHVSPKFFVMDTSRLQSAILLLRNPLDVLPSYYKFLYRMEMGNAPDSHVPVERWVGWRNENLMEQLEKWIEHTKWWLDHYGAQQGKLLVVSFEKLVDEKTGPEELKRIGMFLASVDPKIGTKLAPENQLGCLWEKIIGETVPGVEGDSAKAKKKKSGGFEGMPYPYTIEQLEAMIQTMLKLKREYSKNKQMDQILKEYVKGITVAKRHVQKLLGG